MKRKQPTFSSLFSESEAFMFLFLSSRINRDQPKKLRLGQLREFLEQHPDKSGGSGAISASQIKIGLVCTSFNPTMTYHST